MVEFQVLQGALSRGWGDNVTFASIARAVRDVIVTWLNGTPHLVRSERSKSVDRIETRRMSCICRSWRVCVSCIQTDGVRR